MPFADTFIPEFDQEMKTTRSLLERVPFENAAWKPHIKSTGLAALASHVAQLAGFGHIAIVADELDIAPAGGAPAPRPVYGSTDELLAAFDENVAKSRAAVLTLEDKNLGTPWSLKMGGQAFFTMPRGAVLRTMLMNHIIHHRGQLSVYLRLNDVPLPSIYGPTADT
jgi:uncharacterized damage-inducible protein DinB